MKGWKETCWSTYLAGIIAFVPVGNPFNISPAEETLVRDLVQNKLPQLVRQKEYTWLAGMTLGRIVPLCLGAGVRSLRETERGVVNYIGYLGEFLRQGKPEVVAFLLCNPDLEILPKQRPLFNFWQEEARQKAEAVVHLPGARLGGVFLVEPLYDRRWSKEALRRQLLWDVVVMQDDLFVGVVRVDPWTGETETVEFPVPCRCPSPNLSLFLSLAEAKEALKAYADRTGFRDTHPDLTLEVVEYLIGSGLYIGVFASEVVRGPIREEVYPMKGSKLRLWITPYGELMQVIEEDPYIEFPPV